MIVSFIALYCTSLKAISCRALVDFTRVRRFHIFAYSRLAWVLAGIVHSAPQAQVPTEMRARALKPSSEEVVHVSTINALRNVWKRNGQHRVDCFVKTGSEVPREREVLFARLSRGGIFQLVLKQNG